MLMKSSMSRRSVLGAAVTAGVAGIAGASMAAETSATQRESEWRNNNPDMTYRRLGRTGYMVSEVVMGGNTIAPDNNRHVELAVEMGLNYFDTSPAYGSGKSEEGYGELLKRSSFREKVFVNSKVSVFDSNRSTFYWNMYQELPASEQKKIRNEAERLIADRRVKESRYLGGYGTWQITEIDKAYFSNVMEKYYGDKIDRRKEYYSRIIDSVEGSLKRLKTDYLDLFMCPHGANSPEELVIPEIHEALGKLKSDGKIRAAGLSCHTDPGGVLIKAVEHGGYDAVMIAYSVVNGDFSLAPIRSAWEHDVGVIAMKVARPVYPDRGGNITIPKSRVEALDRIIPGKMKTPMKAYLWALQNPYITCVNSDMHNESHVRDNLTLPGEKVELQPLENLDEWKF